MATGAGETATFAAAAEVHAGVLRALRAIGALKPSRPNAEGIIQTVAASLAGHSEVNAVIMHGSGIWNVVHRDAAADSVQQGKCRSLEPDRSEVCVQEVFYVHTSHTGIVQISLMVYW